MFFFADNVICEIVWRTFTTNLRLLQIKICFFFLVLEHEIENSKTKQNGKKNFADDHQTSEKVDIMLPRDIQLHLTLISHVPSVSSMTTTKVPVYTDLCQLIRQLVNKVIHPAVRKYSSSNRFYHNKNVCIPFVCFERCDFDSVCFDYSTDEHQITADQNT